MERAKMQKAEIFYWLFGTILLSLFSGCQTLLEDDDSLSSAGTLKVKTRSAESVEIGYPVHLYAFSEEGRCVASQVIEDESQKIELQLAKGIYRVVAVSGLSEGYSLPDSPELTDVILLESKGGAETPLLVGKADVKIDKDSEAMLDIALSYVVTAVQIVLTNIPTDVSAVSVALSSFYTSLSMDGTYGGQSLDLEVSCSRTDESVWESEMVYVFPGNSMETVFSIMLKKEDGTSLAYGYTWKGTACANQPLRISGNYSNGIAVDGNFVVKDWDEAVELDFEFGGAKQEQEDDEDGEVEVECSSIPEIGSIWYDCIVADVGEFDGVGVDILLMTLDEWRSPVASVPSLIDGYKVNALEDWRLPTHDEAKLLRSNFHDESLEALNVCIADYDEELLEIDAEERYLCLKEEKYYSFMYVEGKSISSAGTKRSYNVRLVKLCYLTFDE